MPFDRPLPRLFTNIAVRNYAPVASGVYGLSNANHWIYIGESDNLQASLLAHLNEPNSELMKLAPKGFVLETCDRSNRIARLDRLITEYRPVCNKDLRETA